jgi:translation initiation factor IF-3
MENRGFRGQNEKPQQHRINEQIKVASVRVVGENVTAGVYPLKDALAMAEAAGADLVEISPTAEPPVCRIIDYSKFLYQLKKKQKEIKAKSVKVVIKEIRFGPQTDEHDFNFKLKHAVGFLQEGAKVRAYVFFKGRSILFKDQGSIILDRFIKELDEYGKVESPPKLEGKKMIVVIAPKKQEKGTPAP